MQKESIQLNNCGESYAPSKQESFGATLITTLLIKY